MLIRLIAAGALDSTVKGMKTLLKKRFGNDDFVQWIGQLFSLRCKEEVRMCKRPNAVYNKSTNLRGRLSMWACTRALHLHPITDDVSLPPGYTSRPRWTRQAES